MRKLPRGSRSLNLPRTPLEPEDQEGTTPLPTFKFTGGLTSASRTTHPNAQDIPYTHTAADESGYHRKNKCVDSCAPAPNLPAPAAPRVIRNLGFIHKGASEGKSFHDGTTPPPSPVDLWDEERPFLTKQGRRGGRVASPLTSHARTATADDFGTATGTGAVPKMEPSGTKHSASDKGEHLSRVRLDQELAPNNLNPPPSRLPVAHVVQTMDIEVSR